MRKPEERENLSSGFPTRSDTNQAVLSQKMARGLKFLIKEVEGLYYLVKTKVLISCTVTYAKKNGFLMTRLTLSPLKLNISTQNYS